MLPPPLLVEVAASGEAADKSLSTCALAAGVKANDDVFAMGYRTGMGTRMERDVSPPLRLPLLLHDNRRGVSAGGSGGVAASVASSDAEAAAETEEEAAPALASMLRSEVLDDLVNNNDREIRDEVRVRRFGVVPL